MVFLEKEHLVLYRAYWLSNMFLLLSNIMCLYPFLTSYSLTKHSENKENEKEMMKKENLKNDEDENESVREN